jgi:polyhydroxyalkanoate synthesis regulator phasin
MNSDNLVQTIQKGFRVTLGATTSLIESLQDSQKWNENLSKLNQPNWQQLADELAEKGEQTEREARSFVDNLMAQQNAQSQTSGSASSSTTPTTSPEIQQEIQDLTAQIAALRSELEQLRNPDASA